jgi:NADPH:quinone reductase
MINASKRCGLFHTNFKPMKAIRVHEFGGPEVLKFEELPTPSPGNGEVLVRLYAIGVNPVETYVRSGARGPRPLPYTPGADGAGVVEAVGPGVTKFGVGDRVFTSSTLTGSYAEFALCTQSQLHPLPEEISFEQGAAINIPYATAYRALFQHAKVRPGEFVFIHGGSGGVGIAAIQLAVAHGCRIIASAGTERGLNLIRSNGAHHAVDHTDPFYREKVLNLTNGAGPAVILEMLANKNLANDLKLIAPRGRIIIVGSRGSIPIDPRDAMMREATIQGLSLFNANEAERSEIYASIHARLAAGVIRPVIGQSFPLAQAPAAHEAVLAPGAYGKIVMVP